MSNTIYCLNCNVQTNNPKFCSNTCSVTYNNKHRRVSDETKQKISLAVKANNQKIQCQYCNFIFLGKGASTIHIRSCMKNPNRTPGSSNGKKHTIATKKNQAKSTNKKIPTNLFEVSSRTLQKIMKRMGAICSNCGWNKTTCDIHHIKSKKEGGTNDHDNLSILCPNCHRLAHEKKLTPIINIETQYGNKWREHYYSHK
jgi:hypothetical protein